MYFHFHSNQALSQWRAQKVRTPFQKFRMAVGVVGCGEGVVYLTSLGRPTDIGLQLAMPAILVAGKGWRGMFLFLLFLHSMSFLFLFLPCPSLSSLLSLFSLSLGDDTKWPTRVGVSLNPNTINQKQNNFGGKSVLIVLPFLKWYLFWKEST